MRKALKKLKRNQKHLKVRVAKTLESQGSKETWKSGQQKNWNVAKKFGRERDDYRQRQYENYLKTIDRLNMAKKTLPGRVRGGLFTRTESPTGTVARVGSNVAKTATTLNSILSKYQDRFLKLAQAKYYQKQVS